MVSIISVFCCQNTPGEYVYYALPVPTTDAWGVNIGAARLFTLTIQHMRQNEIFEFSGTTILVQTKAMFAMLKQPLGAINFEGM